MNSERALNLNKYLALTTLALDAPGRGIRLSFGSAQDLALDSEKIVEHRLRYLPVSERPSAALSDLEDLFETNDNQGFDPSTVPVVFALFPHVGFSDEELTQAGEEMQRYVQDLKYPVAADNEGPKHRRNLSDMLARRRAAVAPQDNNN